jgi:MFS family permease
MHFRVGWQQVAMVFFMLALATGIVFSSYGIVAAPIGREFHASHTVLMMGVGVLLFAAAVLSPTIGSWMDRYSFRKLLTITAAMLAGGLLALSFAQAMWQVICIYAIFMTLPTTVCGPMGASALVLRWFVRRKALAMGIAISGLSAGSFFFPVIIQHLIEMFDWRITLRIMSLFVAVTLIPAALFLVVDRPSDRNLYPDGAKEPPAGELDQPKIAKGAKRGPQGGTNRQVITDRNFWLLALALGIPMSAGTGTTSNIVLFAADMGFPAELAALVMSLIAVCSASGKLSFAAIGDRFDIRIIQAVSMLFYSAGLAVLASAHSFAALFIGAGLVSYGSGLLSPLWGVVIARAFDANIMGRAMGLIMSVAMVLSVLAPVVIGALRDLTGTYVTPFLVYAVVIAVATLLLKQVQIKRA